MRKKCIITTCGNLLTPGSRLEECQNCRRVYHYWYEKRPDQVRERQHKLELAQERMSRIAIPRGKKHELFSSKVVPFRTKAQKHASATAAVARRG